MAKIGAGASGGKPGGKTGVLGDLYRLRQRNGLTLRALETCPALLDALGTQTIQEAYDLLVAEIRQLGTLQKAVALRHAYGLEGEGTSLTARRGDYAEQIGRHPETLEAWENDMIEELAKRLQSTQTKSPGTPPAGTLFVKVFVHDKRIIGVSTFPWFEKAWSYEGSQLPTVPCCIYRLPGTAPTPLLSLRFDLEFYKDTPSDIWAVSSNDLLHLIVNPIRYKLEVARTSTSQFHEGTSYHYDYTFSLPQPEMYYCVAWEW